MEKYFIQSAVGVTPPLPAPPRGPHQHWSLPWNSCSWQQCEIGSWYSKLVELLILAGGK